MKPVFVLTKISLMAVMFLSNGVSYIIIESIKLILSIKQVGIGSGYNSPTPAIQKVSFFFFFASLFRHSTNSIEMLLSTIIIQPRNTMTSETSINDPILLTLPAAQALA